MDLTTMMRVYPGITQSRAQQYLAGCNQALSLAGCTSVNRAAMFLAQTGEESVSLLYATEIASGAEYQGRTDLGNIYAGDGVRFKGRGFIQITGRYNYTNCSNWAYRQQLVPTEEYFVEHPTELAADKFVWLGPVWYWTVARDMNSFADNNDIVGATRAVNGGLNGLQDRTTRYANAKLYGSRILPSQATANDTAATTRDKDIWDMVKYTHSFPRLRNGSIYCADLQAGEYYKIIDMAELNLRKAVLKEAGFTYQDVHTVDGLRRFGVEKKRS